MTPTPAGRLLGTATGRDLILTRHFRAPIADVWDSLTESERSARWFGPWKGESGTGRTIQVQMSFEETQPWMDMHIDVCEPPRRLGLSAVDEWGSWVLEVTLTEDASGTELVFTHHLTPDVDVSSVGPGWEYYLDNWVAAFDDDPLPAFDDYYPSMKPYYEELAAASGTTE
ncbi:SRPBCC family protein [Nocardia sp. 2]|uniref:SRPBCC family protein n=1 Tax=Nocardia acididurans TaxID=2802282 RepID=A0ABS1MFM8_9NOCA|nr:SRPBCC family protein [Nocardia acididurans]MBL1079372.1 SRPBCC family protein [Nocardia acididurans]